LIGVNSQLDAWAIYPCGKEPTVATEEEKSYILTCVFFIYSYSEIQCNRWGQARQLCKWVHYLLQLLYVRREQYLN